MSQTHQEHTTTRSGNTGAPDRGFGMRKSQHPCKECGAHHYSLSFRADCDEMKVMTAKGVCFTCAFWEVRVSQQHGTVIDGRIYTVGNRPAGSPHNGMAGRRFDIEYFDGRRVTTHDLWAGGEIPERLRSQIPDTARFLGGAGFVRIGDGGAWNPSRTTTATPAQVAPAAGAQKPDNQNKVTP